MSYREVVNTIKFTRDIISRNVKSASICVDCTVGNGNDISLLASIVGEEGKVYGFDIQALAIERTYQRLKDKNLDGNTILIEDNHENIADYIDEEVDFFIYNLGYLPRGDKSIKTDSESTIKSLELALSLLKGNGIILITCYTGHDGGMEEKNAIENFLVKLEQEKFNVLKYDFLNQKNFPPILYCIEKMGGN